MFSFQGFQEVGVAARVAGVAQDGDNALQPALAGRLGECVKAVLAQVAGAAPGAIAHKVQTPAHLVQGVAR